VSEALLVSHVVLWLLVIVLAAVVLALTRQIGLLHERVAPVGALVGAETPRVGEAAPVLEVEDFRGRPQRIGGREAGGRSTLLLFVSPTCPVCKELLPVARRLAAGERGELRLVLASDGPRAEHEAFVRRERLEDETYVLSTPLGLAFQVARLPHAVLIDPDGAVRARGLVNTREHLESLFEARARGVASVQEYLARRAGGA
jgi:methylamine dehydrogenase accessory protein MauD